jgi:hypothetical protein
MWRKVGIARQGAQHGVEMSLGPHPSFQLALRRVLPMAVAPDHTLVGGVMVLRMGAPVLCHARIPHSEELRTDPQDPQWQHCRSRSSELLDPMRATCWRHSGPYAVPSQWNFARSNRGTPMPGCQSPV